MVQFAVSLIPESALLCCCVLCWVHICDVGFGLGLGREELAGARERQVAALDVVDAHLLSVRLGLG